MIEMLNGWIVFWDDPLGEIEVKGPRKGKVKRKSKSFKGRGAKGLAQAKFNQVHQYNPSMKECGFLVL